MSIARHPMPAHRIPVDLAKSYRLLNRGPTVMVSSGHAGRRNLITSYHLLNRGPTVVVSSGRAGRRKLMSAAWSMPLDFSPPKVAVVIDS